MELMKMDHRMALTFHDVAEHWSRDVFDSCERFLQAAALLQPDEYLGFQIVLDEEAGYLTDIFSSQNAWVTERDYQWMFEACLPVVNERTGAAKREFEEEGRWLYVLQKDLSSRTCGRVDKGDNKSFGTRFDGFLNAMREAEASLRVVATPGIERERGLLYFSLPRMMSLSLEAAIMLLFPNTEIKELQACGGAIPESKRLPLIQLTDAMMGMMGLIKRQEEEDREKAKKREEENPEDISDEGLFDYYFDDVEFPSLDDLEDDTSEAQGVEDKGASQKAPSNGKTWDVPIEELELSVRSYNCLKRAGIHTVAQLRNMTEEDFQKVRNLGRKSMLEVQERLREFDGASEKAILTRTKGEDHHYGDELYDLIGLENVKEQVERITCFAKMKRDMMERKQDCKNIALNMEFIGNPGTAKTTVARILAGLFYEIGLLKKPEVMEVGRVDLIAGYVGQTAEKVKKVFENAIGKLLFIDEAYSLVEEGRNYCDEAISTIVQEMENHREETVVVFAGYPDNMKEFFEMNPGLRSRVPFQISFEDYSADEMIQITELEAKRRGFRVSPDACKRIGSMCREATANPKAGNGRFCRNLAENAILSYATRVYGKNGEAQDRNFILTEKDFSATGFLTEEKEVPKTIGF